MVGILRSYWNGRFTVSKSQRGKNIKLLEATRASVQDVSKAQITLLNLSAPTHDVTERGVATVEGGHRPSSDTASLEHQDADKYVCV